MKLGDWFMRHFRRRRAAVAPEVRERVRASEQLKAEADRLVADVRAMDRDIRGRDRQAQP